MHSIADSATVVSPKLRDIIRQKSAEWKID